MDPCLISQPSPPLPPPPPKEKPRRLVTEGYSMTKQTRISESYNDRSSVDPPIEKREEVEIVSDFFFFYKGHLRNFQSNPLQSRFTFSIIFLYLDHPPSISITHHERDHQPRSRSTRLPPSAPLSNESHVILFRLSRKNGRECSRYGRETSKELTTFTRTSRDRM